MGKSRICWRCHCAGISVTFPTRKEYKTHVKTRHQSSPTRQDKKQIKIHRRQIILFRARNGIQKL